jgi:protein-disulfide isomerase
MDQTPQPQSSVPKGPNPLLIPGSIVIAGLLIAGALFAALMINGNRNSTTANQPNNPHLEKNLKPVTAADHIRGSIDAPIKLVEFSDTDCPFCQRFHPTVKGLLEANPQKVAWVYRYFNTHITAHIHTQSEAEAAECVASIAGNDAYWSFIDLLYSKKDFTVNPVKLVATSTLPIYAASFGVDKAKFNDCFAKRTFQSVVDTETKDAQQAGGTGTPYSIAISKAVLTKEIIQLIDDDRLQWSYASGFYERCV